VLRVFVQELFERQDPVHQTLGVVQPVHAQYNLDVIRHVQERWGLLRQLDETVERYADRQCLHLYGPTGQLHQHVGPVHTASEPPTAAVDKVQAVVLDVESGEIVSCKLYNVRYYYVI